MASMNFNLGNTQGTSKQLPKLAGNQIHTVIFKGIKYEEFTGKKDGTTYRVMKVSFANDNGTFEHTIFAPKPEDVERRETNRKDGTKGQMASNFETFKFFIAHLGEQLFPKDYEKFKGLSFDLPEEFQKLVEMLAKASTKAVGKETKLKLAMNKKGEGSLPFFVNINKEGEAFISNNFLGETVFFSDYEVKNMKEAPKPKAVDNDELGEVEEDLGSDLDFGDEEI